MNLDALPRTAEAARRAGLKHYYPGRPCKHGHDSPRYAHGAGGCVQCTVEKNHATDIARKTERWSTPPVRPLVLLGADWAVRAADGTLEDVWRMAVSSKEQRGSDAVDA